MQSRRGVGALLARSERWCRDHGESVVPGLIAVALMLLWAEHDGGYDEDTWYWGALLLLALTAGLTAVRGVRRAGLTRPGQIALGAFALYAAWSYLSITWAQAPGIALEGANRTILYLLVFALMATLPWTARGALSALVVFALGTGALGVWILFRLAAAHHVGEIIVYQRLETPTGYFNGTSALFMMSTLVSTGLASRRQLPTLLRALLLACGVATLQLTLLAESRGWLFTLPLVLVLAFVLVPDRLRFAAAAILVGAGTLLEVHTLTAVYSAVPGAGLNDAARTAGDGSLRICGAALLLGVLVAWLDRSYLPAAFPRRLTRWLGTAAAVAAVVVAMAGFAAATHGHPFAFVRAQWNGFSHPPTNDPTGSHFGTVGSGRYDAWRVALDAVTAHPIGGLGQDNFGDYYEIHRHTGEELSWVHSFWLRLLAHTGIVGFALFIAFLAAAVVLARRARRSRDPLSGAVAGIALLPLVVWCVHGSLDWFWEIPALSGPALGFLGMACSLGSRRRGAGAAAASSPARSTRPGARRVGIGVGVAALAGAVLALGFGYLAQREISLGVDASATSVPAALSDLKLAADLDPLSAIPGRLAGAYALRDGQYAVAQARFEQSIARDPGGWFAWLGAGLAASARGDAARARHDFTVAAGINRVDPLPRTALRRVDTRKPLTSAEAFNLLSVAR
jgi:hypothetical protein